MFVNVWLLRIAPMNHALANLCGPPRFWPGSRGKRVNDPGVLMGEVERLLASGPE